MWAYGTYSRIITKDAVHGIKKKDFFFFFFFFTSSHQVLPLRTLPIDVFTQNTSMSPLQLICWIMRFPCQQQLDTGQSVLRQGVIAHLKAVMGALVFLCGFAERECVNIPQPECRELKWQHSDDPVDHVHRPRMT